MKYYEDSNNTNMSDEEENIDIESDVDVRTLKLI